MARDLKTLGKNPCSMGTTRSVFEKPVVWLDNLILGEALILKIPVEWVGLDISHKIRKPVVRLDYCYFSSLEDDICTSSSSTPSLRHQIVRSSSMLPDCGVQLQNLNQFLDPVRHKMFLF